MSTNKYTAEQMEEHRKMLSQDRLDATRDVRKIIFDSQYQNLKVLQILNGGGAIALISFITTQSQNSNIIILMMIPIVLMIIGLFFATQAFQLFPEYVELQFRRNESLKKTESCNEKDKAFKWYVKQSLRLFFASVFCACLIFVVIKIISIC